VSETPIHNLLTVKETAEYLRIPLPTVYYLVQRGKIPAIHIGGRWRIKKSSLDRDILLQDKQGRQPNRHDPGTIICVSRHFSSKQASLFLRPYAGSTCLAISTFAGWLNFDP
jgi:excisionase family DNA binding protein